MTFDDEDKPSDPGCLLTRREQGLLFWVFDQLLGRQAGDVTRTGWDLPALADRLGFRHFPNVLAYQRACAAGLDDEFRIWDVVREFPVALSPDPSDQPQPLLERGEAFFDQRDYSEALTDFRAAWDALPEPKDEQPLAIRIQAGVADCEFRLGNWAACHAAAQNTLRCGLPADDVFARLRLGQSLYELGDDSGAANWLVPVYLAHGRGPFAGDDPKHLEFFRPRIRPPAGGWPEGW